MATPPPPNGDRSGAVGPEPAYIAGLAGTGSSGGGTGPARGGHKLTPPHLLQLRHLFQLRHLLQLAVAIAFSAAYLPSSGGNRAGRELGTGGPGCRQGPSTPDPFVNGAQRLVPPTQMKVKGSPVRTDTGRWETGEGCGATPLAVTQHPPSCRRPRGAARTARKGRLPACDACGSDTPALVGPRRQPPRSVSGPDPAATFPRGQDVDGSREGPEPAFMTGWRDPINRRRNPGPTRDSATLRSDP